MSQYEKDLEKKIEEITALWQADIEEMAEMQKRVNNYQGMYESLMEEYKCREESEGKARYLEEVYHDNEILRKENGALCQAYSDLEKQLEEANKKIKQLQNSVKD